VVSEDDVLVVGEGDGKYFDSSVVVGLCLFLFSLLIKYWPCLLTPAWDILFCVGNPGKSSHSKSKLKRNLKPPFLL
jgi:hypothetical protein